MSLEQLNTGRFEEIIYDNGDPCLVIFSRKNCHVCKEVVPILENLQPQYTGRFGFFYVDVEEDANLTQRFSLRGVPSVFFFSDGVLKGKLAGNMEEEAIEEKIDQVLGA